MNPRRRDLPRCSNMSRTCALSQSIKTAQRAAHVFRPRFFLLGFVLCAATFAASACGKRRPPLPPVENIPQRTEFLSGVQRGNQVILSWPAPRRNAPAASVQSIRRIDIYRLEEPPDSPLPLTEEEFSARANLIGSVSAEEIARAGDTLYYTDTLNLSPVRLRYALRYVNAANQRAAFSNFHAIEPTPSISEPPLITEIVPGETALTVSWQTPTANVDGSTPPNILGYNIYRTSQAQSEQAPTPLNSAVLSSVTEYRDQTFRFGEEYTYIVRAVSLGTGGAPIESLNSNPKTVTPQDTFHPTAPEGISIAPGPAGGRLAIFFSANKERDVVGYNIYRSTDPDVPKEQWIKLTRELLKRTTYQDELVESGIRYYYYLTAVDEAGNTSQPSETVAETAP